jgi:PAS domain S-box-containing protein
MFGRSWLRPAVILLAAAGLLLSLLAAARVWSIRRDKNGRAIEARAATLAVVLHREFRLNLDALGSVHDFFAGSVQVERSEFDGFASRLLGRHRGIRALEWAPAVPEAEREALERRLTAEGIAGFRIFETDARGGDRPAPPRAIHFPIVFVAPAAEHQADLGFDLASEETRRETLERARASDSPLATPLLRGPRDRERRNGPSVLVFLPVGGGGAPGVVVGVFDVDSLVRTALEEIDLTGLDLVITDSGAAPDEVFSLRPSSGAKPDDRLPILRTGLEFGGRRWTAEFRASEAALENGAWRNAGGVFAAGLLLTLLTLGVVASFLGRAERVEELVRRRTAELAAATAALCESEERHRILFEANPFPLVVFDGESLRVLAVNAAAIAFYGWSREELTSRSLLDLHPAEIVPRILELARTPRSGVWTGEIRTQRRKDGSRVEVEVTTFDTLFEGRAARCASIADITARRQLDRMKDEFVSTVSHELRTPLASIWSSLTLLATARLGELPGAARQVVEVAERNTERLVRLVEEILDLERLSSGRSPVDRKEISIPRLLGRAVEALGALAETRGITITVGEATDRSLLADEERIVQVLVNLVSNAIKFSPAGSEVTLAGVAEEEEALFRVSDRGPGVSAEDAPLLFTRFRRLAKGASRPEGGWGLGLAISKSIVEQHGGSIGVEPRVGGGSTFWFRIPLDGGGSPATAS